MQKKVVIQERIQAQFREHTFQEHFRRSHGHWTVPRSLQNRSQNGFGFRVNGGFDCSSQIPTKVQIMTEKSKVKNF